MKTRMLVLILFSLALAMGDNTTATAGDQPIWTTEIEYNSVVWKAPRKKDLPKGMVFDKTVPPTLTIIDGLGIPTAVLMKKAGGRKWKFQRPVSYRENPLEHIGVYADGSSVCQAYVTWQTKGTSQSLKNGNNIKVEDWRPLTRMGELNPPGRNAGEDSWVNFPCGGDPLFEGVAPVAYTRIEWPEVSNIYSFRDDAPKLGVDPQGYPFGFDLTFRQFRRDDFLHWYLLPEDVSQIPCNNSAEARVSVFDPATGSELPGKEYDYIRVRDLYFNGVKVTNITKGEKGSEYTYPKFMCDGTIVTKK